MNLYLISQYARRGYDTYDSAVVAAESEKEAKLICPNSYQNDSLTKSEFEIMNQDNWAYARDRTWVSDPLLVNVKLLGKAVPKTSKGVICSSFNAG